MKNKSIMEIAHDVNDILKLHLEITKDAIDYHIFFDKNNEVYVSILQIVTDSQIKCRWGYSKHEVLKQISVYSYNLLKNKELQTDISGSKEDNYANERVGKLLYNTEGFIDPETGKDYIPLFITLIKVENKENSNKGIGNNILRLAHYYSLKENCDGIMLTAKPHDYLEENPSYLIRFYEKNDIKLKPLPLEEEIYEGKKTMLPKHRNNIKDHIIYYPVEDKNFLVIVPDKKLEATGFKGREIE